MACIAAWCCIVGISEAKDRQSRTSFSLLECRTAVQLASHRAIFVRMRRVHLQLKYDLRVLSSHNKSHIAARSGRAITDRKLKAREFQSECSGSRAPKQSKISRLHLGASEPKNTNMELPSSMISPAQIPREAHKSESFHGSRFTNPQPSGPSSLHLDQSFGSHEACGDAPVFRVVASLSALEVLRDASKFVVFEGCEGLGFRGL